jgi:membrane-bound lytic murein transglycosylase B
MNAQLASLALLVAAPCLRAAPLAAQPALEAPFFEALSAGRAALLDAKIKDAPPAPPPWTAAQVEQAVLAQLAGTEVPPAYVGAAFADPRLKADPRIPPQARKPSESLPYSRYRLIFMTEPRIAAGAAFMRANKAQLDAVAARYGVDTGLLAALVGVETFYGTHTGGYEVFNALNTLAEVVPERRAFAVRELSEFLRLTLADKLDVYSVLGSYAGAFGYGQFIPSTFNRYAVDFDGDGLKSFDRWPDVLATMSNYLVKQGYDAASADFSRGSKNYGAIFAYNHSDNYVQVVLELRAAILARLP